MTRGQNRLGKLEAVRGFAAAVVVLGHAKLATGGLPGILLSTGQEAVILFFILSGFVVHYATLGRAKHPVRFPGYFQRRFRRIYPIFVVSLALAYLIHCLAVHRWTGPHWSELGGNLAMLQDMAVGKRGVWFDTYLSNWPLWSLAYEWWFYMLFFPLAVSLAIPVPAQRYVAGGVSLLAFVGYHLRPNPPCLYLSYFAIWWTGVELSREYAGTGRLTWRQQSPSLAILAGLAACWGVPVLLALRRHQPLRLGIEPVLQFRHFADATTAVVIGLVWYKARFPGFRFVLGPFAVVAPVTYAVYVCHVPMYQLCEQVFPRVPSLARTAIALAVLFPMAYLLEVRLQRRINKAFDRLAAVIG